MILQILTIMTIIFLFDLFHYQGFTNKRIRKMATIATNFILLYGQFAVLLGCVIAIWFMRDFVKDEWRAFTFRKK